jgi:hypothetical protein
MKNNILLWLKGLAAALVGGAVAGVAQAAASGSLGGTQLKVAAASGAALTLGAYLKQSPIADK